MVSLHDRKNGGKNKCCFNDPLYMYVCDIYLCKYGFIKHNKFCCAVLSKIYYTPIHMKTEPNIKLWSSFTKYFNWLFIERLKTVLSFVLNARVCIETENKGVLFMNIYNMLYIQKCLFNDGSIQVASSTTSRWSIICLEWNNNASFQLINCLYRQNICKLQ